VAGADASPSIAMEILVEQCQVTPVGIALEFLYGAMDWSAIMIVS
jgi:hypothetical protein